MCGSQGEPLWQRAVLQQPLLSWPRALTPCLCAGRRGYIPFTASLNFQSPREFLLHSRLSQASANAVCGYSSSSASALPGPVSQHHPFALAFHWDWEYVHVSRFPTCQ